MGTRTTEKRTDDEKSVPAQTATDAEIPEATEAEAAGKAAAKADEQADDNAALAAQDEASDLGADDAIDEPGRGTDTAPVAASSGIAAGAGAVVAAGLGLASVTGTWLGTTMAERANLMGQIKLQSGKASDQIAAVYGASWHTNAMVNGVFALLAVIAAAVALTRSRATWVRAVAFGGLALGVLGILISAGMYLDLFGSMPTVPKAPPGGPAAP